MKDEIQNFLKSLAKNRSEAEEEENLSPTLSASVELAESEPVKAGLKYLSHMAKDESWGDFLCLMAAKRILGRHIHVFEMTRNECRKKKIDMRLLSDDPKSLLLLRVARKHYNAVIRCGPGDRARASTGWSIYSDSEGKNRFLVHDEESDGNCMFRGLCVVAAHAQIDINEDHEERAASFTAADRATNFCDLTLDKE